MWKHCAWISPSTFHPDERWVKQQAVAFLEHANQIELPPKLLMHDRDTKFTKAFDAIFDTAGAEGKRTAFRLPMLKFWRGALPAWLCDELDEDRR